MVGLLPGHLDKNARQVRGRKNILPLSCLGLYYFLQSEGRKRGEEIMRQKLLEKERQGGGGGGEDPLLRHGGKAAWPHTITHSHKTPATNMSMTRREGRTPGNRPRRMEMWKWKEKDPVSCVTHASKKTALYLFLSNAYSPVGLSTNVYPLGQYLLSGW